MKKTKYLNKLSNRKFLTFLTITILGMGILFNVIYASPAIKQEASTSYLQTIDHKPRCGNNVCELWLGETPANCPEDCYLP